MATETGQSKTLLMPIGNVLRGDDALASALADAVFTQLPESWELAYRHQLQVEDAWLIGQFDRIIFVDATVDIPEKGWSFEPCSALPFSPACSHFPEPGAMLHLARMLYNRAPDAYILAIGGYQWAHGTAISAQAQLNLNNAILFMEQYLKKNNQ